MAGVAQDLRVTRKAFSPCKQAADFGTGADGAYLDAAETCRDEGRTFRHKGGDRPKRDDFSLFPLGPPR